MRTFILQCNFCRWIPILFREEGAVAWICADCERLISLDDEFIDMAVVHTSSER